MKYRLCILFIVILTLASCRREGDVVAERMELPSQIAAYNAPLSAEDIWLAGAMTDPEGSMERLRELAPGGSIERKGWPVAYENAAWGAAAWEVYCATGSEEWLREAYNIIMGTMRSERTVSLTRRGLVNGLAQRLEVVYPTWLTVADKAQSIALYTNAFHYRTLEAAAEMARLLNSGTEETLRLEAKQLREEINRLFWLPASSGYGAFTYGNLCPLTAPVTDTGASMLCGLFGIAIPEMSAASLAAIPAVNHRWTDFYPPMPDGSSQGNTQALVALSAAQVDNPAVFTEAISTEVGPVAGNAMLLRGLLGLKLTPDALEVTPYLPENPEGKLTVGPLRWRESLLTFTLHGTGNRIASFMVDSVESRPSLPASLQEDHHVDIVMASNTLPEGTLKALAPDEAPKLPPTPSLKLTAPTTLTLSPKIQNGTYNIYIDGVLTSTTTTPTFTPPAGKSLMAVAEVSDDGTEGFASASFIPASAQVRVNASSITPRRPPLHLIKDRTTASRYIELAPRHNTRLTFYANIPHPGRYAVRIGYSNATKTTAMRTLGVIDSLGADRPAGLLLCPPVREADWIRTGESTIVVTELKETPCRLSLTYVTGTILLNYIDIIALK